MVRSASILLIVICVVSLLTRVYHFENGLYPPFILKGDAYQTPTSEQKNWALATCAVLAEYNGDRYNLLGGSERTPERIKFIQNILASGWGIKNREDLFKTLKWIEEGGHRKEFDNIYTLVSRLPKSEIEIVTQKVASNPEISNKLRIVLKYHNELGSKSVAGWDFVRYISLCGWGYVAGYITEEEAWKIIMPAAQLIQRTFSSWGDLGENYLIGREFWSQKQTVQRGQRMRECYRQLLLDPASPWFSIPWSISLAPGSCNLASVLNHYWHYWLSVLKGIYLRDFCPTCVPPDWPAPSRVGILNV